jgi:hypothetical protein
MSVAGESTSRRIAIDVLNAEDGVVAIVLGRRAGIGGIKIFGDEYD